MDGINGRDVYLYSIVRDFCGRVGIFAEFARLLYVGRLGIFACQFYCASDCDNLFFAATFVNARGIYGDIECRDGGFDNLDFAKCFDGLLGRNWELFNDFLD